MKTIELTFEWVNRREFFNRVFAIHPLVSSRRGFTLIELILVIVIIGILTVSAVPAFLELDREAKVAKTKELLGVVRSAHHMEKASTLIKNNGKIPVPPWPGLGTYLGGQAPKNPLTNSNATGQGLVASFPTVCTQAYEDTCNGVVKRGWLRYFVGGPENSKVYACTDDCSTTDPMDW